MSEWIYFTQENGHPNLIRRIRPDGSQLETVYSFDEHPYMGDDEFWPSAGHVADGVTVSPNKRWLAIICGEDASPEYEAMAIEDDQGAVYRMPIGGGRWTPLTTLISYYNIDKAVWASDSDSIFYGEPFVSPGGIYEVSTDGNDTQTHWASGTSSPAVYNGKLVCLGFPDQRLLLRYDSAGGSPTTLYNAPSGYFCWYPAITPNGVDVIFTRTRLSPAESGIFKVPLAGGSITSIISPGFGSAINPSGTKLVYRTMGWDGELRICDIDGSNDALLLASESGVKYGWPDWVNLSAPISKMGSM